MKLSVALLIVLACIRLCAQETIEKTLENLNRGTVPYITVASLEDSDTAMMLDTRSWEEYQVSHLKHAIWVGYEHFNKDRMNKVAPDKNTPLVVYCSIGVRSEDIGEKLIQMGYTDVHNLYGGIFLWKNSGLAVYDSLGNQTNRVHAYNKHWGRLLKQAEKVY